MATVALLIIVLLLAYIVVLRGRVADLTQRLVDATRTISSPSTARGSKAVSPSTTVTRNSTGTPTWRIDA